MVDRVLRCEGREAVTELTVRKENIFLDDNILSPAGIIENMAQSCAARMGYANVMKDEPIRIGYIGDIRDCTILRQPKCNETLHTHIEIIEEVFNLTLAYVTTRINGETIATARMKIALTDDVITES